METPAYGIGRVRDVRQGRDGYIYLAVEDRGRAGSCGSTGGAPVGVGDAHHNGGVRSCQSVACS